MGKNEGEQESRRTDKSDVPELEGRSHGACRERQDGIRPLALLAVSCNQEGSTPDLLKDMSGATSRTLTL